MNPFAISPETDSEARNQAALFAWLAMCGHFGKAAANDPRCYTKKGYAIAHYQLAPSHVTEALSVIYAVPNGSNLASGALGGAGARATGLMRGVPDICIPVPMREAGHWPRTPQAWINWAGMYDELKTPDGMAKFEKAVEGSDTTEGQQKVWHTKLKRAGHHVVVTVGWINSRDAITAYLQI